MEHIFRKKYIIEIYLKVYIFLLEIYLFIFGPATYTFASEGPFGLAEKCWLAGLVASGYCSSCSTGWETL